MKTKLLSFLAASALIAGAVSASAANVSVSVFYDSLEPYGEWMDTDDYGYVWHPRDVDENWRPYTVGSWAHTDAGWTWVSEEPFGWATYHYGRWVEIDRVGWSWVPDREWGPAWVSWRRSDRHVGWAPLPPEARFEARVGFRDWVDSYYDIGPAYYSFVKVRDFGAPRLRTVIVEPRENVTIINETRNITNITYVNNVIVNEGPQYDAVVRESAQPIRRLKLERRTDVDFRDGGDRRRFDAEVRGDVLRVAAPEVEVSSDAKPRKAARKLDRVEVDRGWRKAGDPKAVEQLRAKVASETKIPAELPPSPKLRGSDRGERPQTATSDAPPRPEPATADTSRRDMKPGAEKSSAAATKDSQTTRDGKEKPRTAITTDETEKPTAATSAEDKEKARATATRERKDKPRPSATAETSTPREESAPDSVAARQKRSPKEKAAPGSPDQETERPNAAIREQTPQRPEAREGDRSRPDAAERPDKEQPKKRPDAAPANPTRELERAPDRAPGERPDTNERPKRPEALERPDRPERKAAPAPAEERETRKGPPAREERSAERARPEAIDRSPENRPPAAEPKAAAREDKRGGGDKPDKGGKGDDKKKD